MKITVLIENKTERDDLTAEHGLSFHIAYNGASYLLDAGSSGAFADNAKVLGVDLSAVDTAVLSHGHYDHADGLRRFFAENNSAKLHLMKTASDGYFSLKNNNYHFVGIHQDLCTAYGDRFVPVTGITELAPGVTLVPDTMSSGPFASRETHLFRKVSEDNFVPDDFSHEQSLVFETPNGLVVFNSCSHSGIVNIVRGVLNAFPGNRVCAVVGGFHMMSPGQNAMNCTEDYVRAVGDMLADMGVKTIYTGHCTGDAAFSYLRAHLGDRVRYLYTGETIEL